VDVGLFAAVNLVELGLSTTNSSNIRMKQKT